MLVGRRGAVMRAERCVRAAFCQRLRSLHRFDSTVRFVTRASFQRLGTSHCLRLFSFQYISLRAASQSWTAELARRVLFTRCERYLCFDRLSAERAAAARVILEGIEDASADAVNSLEQRRAELQRERMQIKKDLRNENRKRKRLLAKARGLSVDDLLTVVTMKATAKAKAKAKAEARARA